MTINQQTWSQSLEYYLWRRFIHKYDPSSKYYQLFESPVPDYVLPDPLRLSDGTPIKDLYDWESQRRPEILSLFHVNVYGTSPRPRDPEELVFWVDNENPRALSGSATRKEVVISLTPDGPMIRLLLYLPNAVVKSNQKCPLFLGLNFWGNQSIHRDSGITVNTKWSTCPKSPAKSRGIRSYRWPVETILQRGYGLGTAYYGDILLDRLDDFKQGLPSYFDQSEQRDSAPFESGAISTWAWGLSRLLDYCTHDPQIASDKVIVIGHSRLGKTALWTAAQDTRFAMAIANDSGCGGARIFRRQIGETIAMINQSFPHWFCTNFKRFNDREQDLPVDQHMLIGLIAPRPVYVSSAQRDIGSDPKGEFLGVKHASPIYKLYGFSGLPAEEMPPVSTPVMETLGYHIRLGQHDITPYDWQHFLTFADLHMCKTV